VFIDVESFRLGVPLILEMTRGVEQSRYTLAVRRVPCEPRLSLRARLWLDMTNDEEVERNMPRLLAALRENPALAD
jgi:hypothetical protein